MMTQEMTITRYANGITVTVECTATSRVFEDSHCLTAIQYILENLGGEYCLSPNRAPNLSQTPDTNGISSTEAICLLESIYRARAILGKENQPLPKSIDINACGDGFIMIPNTSPDHTRVYEPGNVPALIQDLASLCFPELGALNVAKMKHS